MSRRSSGASGISKEGVNDYTTPRKPTLLPAAAAGGGSGPHPPHLPNPSSNNAAHLSASLSTRSAIRGVGGGPTHQPSLVVRDVGHILASIKRVRGPFTLRDETSPATLASEKAALRREEGGEQVNDSSGGGGEGGGGSKNGSTRVNDGEENPIEEVTGSPWWVRPASASQSALLHYNHLRKFPKKVIMKHSNNTDEDYEDFFQQQQQQLSLMSMSSSVPTVGAVVIRSPPSNAISPRSPPPSSSLLTSSLNIPRSPVVVSSSPRGAHVTKNLSPTNGHHQSSSSHQFPVASPRSHISNSYSQQQQQLSTTVIPPVHCPNWRALLYTDIYKGEDEQKEELSKKYEALVGAQRKLFPQFGGGGGAARRQSHHQHQDTLPSSSSLIASKSQKQQQQLHNKGVNKQGNKSTVNKGSKSPQQQQQPSSAAARRGTTSFTSVGRRFTTGVELRSPGKYLRDTGKISAPEKLATSAQINSARTTMLNARSYFCGRAARSRSGGAGSQPTSPRSTILFEGVSPPTRPDGGGGSLGGATGGAAPLNKHVMPLLAGRPKR